MIVLSSTILIFVYYIDSLAANANLIISGKKTSFANFFRRWRNGEHLNLWGIHTFYFFRVVFDRMHSGFFVFFTKLILSLLSTFGFKWPMLEHGPTGNRSSSKKKYFAQQGPQLFFSFVALSFSAKFANAMNALRYSIVTSFSQFGSGAFPIHFLSSHYMAERKKNVFAGF